MSPEILEFYHATVNLIVANPIPFSMALSALVGYGIGKISGKRAAKRDPNEVEKENEELAKELRKHKHNSRAHEQNAERLKGAVDRLKKERNEYERIASSHDINHPVIPERHVETVRVWKRSYNALPLDNVKAIKKDLEEFKGQHIILHIDVEPLGGWKKKMSKFSVKREGSIEHIVHELKTMIRDVDYGFVRVRPYSYTNEKEWIDDDSPVRFIVRADVVYRYDVEPPEVHTVEVAVPTTEVEIVELEKIVFIEDDGDIRNPMGGHTRDEIIEIVKEYDLRKQAEQELDKLSVAPPRESTEERAAEAMRKKKLAAAAKNKQRN